MDNPQTTITLPDADWNVLHRALYELPMKEAAPVVMRLQQALIEARKPAEIIEPPPALREVKS